MKYDATGYRYLQAVLAGSCLFAMTSTAAADGLIRKRLPDREVYQSPTINDGQAATVQKPTAKRLTQTSVAKLVPAPTIEPQSPVETERQDIPLPVVLSEATVTQQNESSQLQQVGYEQLDAVQPAQRAVTQTSAKLAKRPKQHAVRHAIVQPGTTSHVETCSCKSCQANSTMASPAYQGEVIYSEPTYDDYGDHTGYDLGGCDTIGCDSMGCAPCIGDDWFGSVEVMLMFRNGDHLPPLVTTDQLDGNFQVLSGAEKVFDEMTTGGRLTLGMWLDPYKDRSVVGRLWFAGEETYDFTTNDSLTGTFGRPFFDVEFDEQGFQVIAEPGVASGEVKVHADSQIFGGDVSIRQLWYKSQGATVDLLYGYQYMRVEENLSISSRSTSLDGVDAGAMISLQDSFGIQNDFHGAQIGVSSFYREGCWSFSSLAKAAFGNTRRRVDLSGNQVISIDGDTATQPNGLLVRESNAGVHDDNTFGWVPELDFTLGWQRFPSFDVTFGYHIIAMTEALRPSGVIDPQLGTDLSDTTNRPSVVFRKDTVYVQGLHFGLSYIY
ncbi:BBP7 family outer membrane beta-barrel protein [Rhodopirellula sp. MGV]|uniref:BBP7 family outer membrane beta-barrel protein n=1 Tax=Rhodopirellula sp. MGV TaxID=2023130 RepID=UPI000B964108|nr:BBP7 family outer membrane beta-barrel protein [Rhodopirellula sp. MGV]OYP34007.1 hypothetical protein CGZ80_16450 [Rhodopirellula sp. MGV]PNY38366.1 hypothetical protein C2E31_03405 [Rhodopirellula baltica]